MIYDDSNEDTENSKVLDSISDFNYAFPVTIFVCVLDTAEYYMDYPGVIV